MKKAMWLEQIKEAVENNYKNMNYNNGLYFLSTKQKEITKEITEDFDWGYYSKRYNHPKKFTEAKFYIPIKYKRNANYYKSKYFIIDGVINLNVQNLKPENEYKILKASWLKLNKSKNFEVIKGWIALSKSTSYHSTISKKDALIKLERKVKRAEDKEKLNSKKYNLESILNKKDFHRLTGACFAGIEEFLTQLNIKVKKMRMKDIIELLEVNNEDYYADILKRIIV